MEMLMTDLALRAGAALSHALMWTAVPPLVSDGPVPSDTITISLAVFVTSIIATAVFTWAVARFDNKRTIEVETLRAELREIRHTMNNWTPGQ